MPDMFRVTVTKGMWQDKWPDYFDKFYNHCNDIAHENGHHVNTVINRMLRPHGRLIQTKTQGWYLRWDKEEYHTMFVLKWC